MTNEEAIRILDPATTREALYEIEYYAGFNGKRAAMEAVNEACVMGAEALQRLIPKPVEKDEAVYGTPYICPECVADVNKVHFYNYSANPVKKVSYCWNCGQAIDWSKENEQTD